MLKALKYSYVISLMLFFYPFTGNAEEVKYNKREESLSVNIVNSSLVKALRDISVKTGVAIEMELGIDRYITVEFNDLSLEEGLKEIIRPNSYAMTFKEKVKRREKGLLCKNLQVFKNGTSGFATLDVGIDNAVINKPELFNTYSEQRIKADDLSVNKEKEIPTPLPQENSSKRMY